MTKFEEAVLFAVECHAGMRRKGTGTPYILHPMEAASIAASITNDEDVLVAALLHDTLEDAGVTELELTEKFGERVTALVKSETENKRRDRPAASTWMLRKEESLAYLANAAQEVKILWLSDKLSNIRSFYRMFLEEGMGFMRFFNEKDPAKHAWYYRSIAALMPELSGTAAYKEYVNLINEVFKGV